MQCGPQCVPRPRNPNKTGNDDQLKFVCPYVYFATAGAQHNWVGGGGGGRRKDVDADVPATIHLL